MKGVVLAGGYATRLRPISYAMPKLLFPVVCKPMIHWTLDLLKSVGTTDVVLGVNYLADILRANVGSTYKGMRIDYSLESTPLGTAGPLKLASVNTQLDETFIAMNGDIIAQVNLPEMLKQHKETKALVTDALHEVRDPSRFGVVKLDSEKHIQAFVEKPRAGTAPSRLVNAGIYIIEPEVLKLIPPNRKVSLEREIFPTLAKEGRLYGFNFLGDWFDIGSLVDYRKANFSLLRASNQDSDAYAANVAIASEAKIRRPICIGENSKVEDGSRLGPNALLGRNCSIEGHSQVSNSILFDDVTVGEDCEINGAILASRVKLSKGVKIGRGSIISPNVTVAEGVRIASRAIIHPHKEIERNVGIAAHVM